MSIITVNSDQHIVLNMVTNMVTNSQVRTEKILPKHQTFWIARQVSGLLFQNPVPTLPTMQLTGDTSSDYM